jgi:hypothetical protein
MQDIENPWYREPWPWLLIGLPAIAVLASLTSAVLAFDGADPIIEDNYYQRGLDINQTLARVRQAAALGVHASLAYDGLRAGEAVWVQVKSQGGVQDAALRLRLIHPARAGVDRELILARVPGSPDGAAEYSGRWPDAATGARAPADPAAVNWRIALQGRDWQVEGELAGRNDLAVR